ncbi:MAG TPA: DUF3800 domain-containing protein [Anaeromyxobacteraceae bacterium]|nr:DUF3800 domain-containing protein [Anaeromyxobacteraceae bacterium]
MLILYLDEFGHAGAWDPSDPAHRHHPLFGLAGIVVECAKARDLDRGYLHLKRSYYRYEIERTWRGQGKREERFEPKQLSSRRDRRFAIGVLQLVRRLGGRLIVHGLAKRIGVRTHDERALYHSVMQGALRAFDAVIEASGAASGIVIADRRSETADTALLESAQSYLFSNQHRVGRVAETPLLVRSDWPHGVQAADTVGRVVASVHRYRTLGEPSHAAADREFGDWLDALSADIAGKLSSVYVRKPTRGLGPDGDCALRARGRWPS